MGWSSGTRVFSGVVDVIKSNVTEFEDRKNIYIGLIEVFRDADWDTMDEIVGEDPAYDAVYRELFQDDEDTDDNYQEEYWSSEDDE